MKIKIEGCLSWMMIAVILLFGLFLTYLFALGIVTFVDKIHGKPKVEKIIVIDTSKVSKQFEDIWDKAIPLSDDAV